MKLVFLSLPVSYHLVITSHKLIQYIIGSVIHCSRQYIRMLDNEKFVHSLMLAICYHEKVDNTRMKSERKWKKCCSLYYLLNSSSHQWQLFQSIWGSEAIFATIISEETFWCPDKFLFVLFCFYYYLLMRPINVWCTHLPQILFKKQGFQFKEEP